MRILRSFWHSFINSASSPSYYGDVLKAKSSFSWKYLALLMGIILFINTIELLAYTAPAVNSFDADQTLTDISNLYPEDLALNVSNGRVGINQDLPYSIPMPSEWMSDNVTGKQISSLVLFSTDDGIPDALRDQNSIFIIGETIVYVPDDNSGGFHTYQALPIPEDVDPFLLTNTDVQGFFTDIKEMPFVANRWFVTGYIVLVLVGAVLFFPFVLFFRVISVFVLGVLGWVISIFMSKKLSYMEVVRLSVHALTPLVIIETIGGILGILYMTPGVFLVLYIVWIVVVLRSVIIVPTPIDSQS